MDLFGRELGGVICGCDLGEGASEDDVAILTVPAF